MSILCTQRGQHTPQGSTPGALGTRRARATDGTPHTQSLLRPRYGLTCTLKPLLRATLSPHMLHTKPTQLEHAGMPHSANAAA